MLVSLYPQECQDYQAVQKFRNSYVHFLRSSVCRRIWNPTSILLYPENFMELDEYIRLIQQEYLTRPPFPRALQAFLMEELFSFFSEVLPERERVDQKASELRKSFQRLPRLGSPGWGGGDWVWNCSPGSSLSRVSFCPITNVSLRNAPRRALQAPDGRPNLSNEALQVQQVCSQTIAVFTNMQHFSRYFQSPGIFSPEGI